MDSGALVIDTIASSGKINTPIKQRILWCVFIGLIAIALTLSGGLSSLQAMALATAFPFCFILILMCVSTIMGLKKELEKKISNFISTEIEWIPFNSVQISKERTDDLVNFFETLEEDDDVQNIYSNAKFLK